jgi:MFS transporter, PPP family, 3-phenylpropionic acid transporter
MNQGGIIRILYFLVFSCTASWLPVLADFGKSKNFSGNQIAILLSITPIMMFLVQPVYGSIADKWGIKKMLQISFLGTALSFVGYQFTNGISSILFVATLMSFFYNGLQPFLDSLALQLEAKDKSFSYGSLRMAGAMGWSATGIITGQVIEQINIQSIFYISAITMILAFGIAFLLDKNTRTMDQSMQRTNLNNIAEILKGTQIIKLLISVLILSIAGTSIWNFYSLYMKENGASAGLVGLGLSFQGLCEIPLFYLSALIIRKYGITNILMITAIATMIRLILYSMVKIPAAALPIELLHGISWSLYWVVCIEMVNKLVPVRWIATGQSILYAVYFGIGAVIGNFWAGWLYDQGISISNLFLINAGVVLIAIPFIHQVNNSFKAATTLS